jgi:hypothetical protein
MSTIPTRRIGTPRGIEFGDLTDIQNLPEVTLDPRGRPSLLPEEIALSLPETVNVASVEIQILNRMLGPKLTVDNPVWRGDPVPRMRALQKLLVAHSLSLPEDDRSECLDAISLVERAAQLRLRWLQMRLSEMELIIDRGMESNNATQTETN